jgi:hypothetical protein
LARNKHELPMSRDLQNRISYFVCCITAFANQFGISPRAAYSYLDRFKGISFLDECYEAEHQLSIADAVSDLATICQRHGGTLAL